MTLLELFVLVLICYLVFKLMKPFRKRFENFLKTYCGLKDDDSNILKNRR